ncbi:MAG TPA: tRNA pseudouridine(38-40) synthase TruA [Peptococcaceae bacterium]|nr:tRNA pseudouridine(38-40) synthase TruA [Peptococcaceae bacterium]
MRFLKLVLEYDGSGFHGFQKQTGTGLRTVQEVLENALKNLTGEEIQVHGAGRTDAGVHALGQVVHFATSASIPASRFPAALNGCLPPDLVVLRAEEVDPSFHARYSALAKKYCYVVWNQEKPSALLRNYCFHYPVPLDAGLMSKGAAFFEGVHDFRSFSASGSSAKTTTRHLFSFKVQRKRGFVVFTVTADGFLYKMVRLMVGTLLEVGRGKLLPEAVREILETRRRGLGGPAAPPQGLYLVRVYYPGDYIDDRDLWEIESSPYFSLLFS